MLWAIFQGLVLTLFEHIWLKYTDAEELDGLLNGTANGFTHLNTRCKTHATNSPSDNSALQVVDLYELPKAAGVVVVGCLGIAECLNKKMKWCVRKSRSYF